MQGVARFALKLLQAGAADVMHHTERECRGAHRQAAGNAHSVGTSCTSAYTNALRSGSVGCAFVSMRVSDTKGNCCSSGTPASRRRPASRAGSCEAGQPLVRRRRVCMRDPTLAGRGTAGEVQSDGADERCHRGAGALDLQPCPAVRHAAKSTALSSPRKRMHVRG